MKKKICNNYFHFLVIISKLFVYLEYGLVPHNELNVSSFTSQNEVKLYCYTVAMYAARDFFLLFRIEKCYSSTIEGK